MYTLSFVFSFPLINKQITKQWIDAIQIKGFVPTKYSRICSKHFLESDFKNINGQRLHLKNDAVPSVFCTQNQILTKCAEEKDNTGIIEAYESPIDISIYNSCEECPIKPKRVKRQIKFEHSYSNSPFKALSTTSTRGRPQRTISKTPRKVQLKCKVKRLCQQVRRLKSKASNCKELLQSIKKKGLIGDNEHNTLLDEFEGMSNEIFRNQMNNRNKKATSQRYSSEFKKIALTLNYYSPKAYKYCKTILKLLHPRLKLLGCEFGDSFDSIKSWFKHPINGEKFFFTPDACHMIKLVRNILGNCLVLESMTGQIKWCYFEYLHELQTNLSLKFANKIFNVHINWQQNKIKVKTAAQLSSSSTANALQYLKDNNYTQFSGCDETINFCRTID
ncbi:hypothetical protein QTP88_005402 [Uroleucon formosanum]